MVLFEGLYAGAMGGALWVVLGLVFAFIVIRALLVDFPGLTGAASPDVPSRTSRSRARGGWSSPSCSSPSCSGRSSSSSRGMSTTRTRLRLRVQQRVQWVGILRLHERRVDARVTLLEDADDLPRDAVRVAKEVAGLDALDVGPVQDLED